MVRGNAGVGRLLSPVLMHLAQTDAGLSAAGSARLADEVAELTITAALEAARSVEDCQSGPEHLRRIQVFIEEHLADPALTPQLIAQEFFHLDAHIAPAVRAAWAHGERLDQDATTGSLPARSGFP